MVLFDVCSYKLARKSYIYYDNLSSIVQYLLGIPNTTDKGYGVYINSNKKIIWTYSTSPCVFLLVHTLMEATYIHCKYFNNH